MMEINLKPIGTVQSPLKERERGNANDIIAEIVIDPEYAEGLDNLEEFSHIIVIFYFHRTHRSAPLKVHPKYRKESTPVGVFASRSPDRPNALGKTVVELMERHGNVLKVRGLDAIDGTPVLDIKPYLPDIDAVPGAGVPRWMTQG